MLHLLESFTLPTLIVAAVAYLLGSISFSIIFTKMFDNVDIRTLGSGNAGLTNVFRSVGVKAGTLTLIFDFSKGAAAVLVGRAILQYFCARNGIPMYFTQYGAYIAGVMCVIGHIYPLFFKFKGGKGVLSSAGMMAFIDWRVFLLAVTVFIIVFAISKIVSLSSIIAAASLPFANFLLVFLLDYRQGFSPYGPVPLSFVWVTTVMSIFVAFFLIFMHRSNIRRLKNGTEKKFAIKRAG